MLHVYCHYIAETSKLIKYQHDVRYVHNCNLDCMLEMNAKNINLVFNLIYALPLRLFHYPSI